MDGIVEGYIDEIHKRVVKETNKLIHDVAAERGMLIPELLEIYRPVVEFDDIEYVNEGSKFTAVQKFKVKLKPIWES